MSNKQIYCSEAYNGGETKIKDTIDKTCSQIVKAN